MKWNNWTALSNRFWSSETIVMTTFALVVGSGTGLGIAVFRGLLDGLFEWTITGWSSTFRLGLILFPTLGGLLVAAWMALMSRKGQTGLGVAGIMEAVALHAGRIDLRGSLGRIGGAILTVGLGGSAGPEDPSVQIGATLGSQLGQWFHLTEARVKTLVGCGAAAGIGAAFNAPISGVFFAIEIILGEFSAAAVGLIVLAAVAGAVVIQSLLGSKPAFQVPGYELLSPAELGLYALLGVVAAVVAFLYIRLIILLEDFFESWAIPHWIKPALGGLAVGLFAFFIRPEVLGTGYPAIGEVLTGQLNVPLILLLLVGLKLLATPLTIGSGGQGGLFAPSLFLGAMLGVAFGSVAQMLFPGAIAPAPAYGLVGMGAVLAGAVRAPITAILLPFELTQDYRIVLPLMFATVVSTILAGYLEPESVYTLKQKRRGLDLRARKDVNLMRTILVQEAMTPVAEIKTVPANMSVANLAHMFQVSSHHGFVVLDESHKLYGVVTLVDLERAVEAERVGAQVGEIATTNALTVFPDDTLEDALRHFGALDVGRIPVVARADPREVVGLLRRADIVQAYSHALLDKHAREHHIERLRLQSAARVELVEMDLAYGDAAVAKRLKEIVLPADCVVVSIQRGGRVVIPRGETQLLAGDRVVALTNRESEAALRQALVGRSPTAKL
ncbi:MAG: chloride channel protein [Anaerolineae bacterium]